MSAPSRSRGSAPVAHLDALPPVERAAIRCLRGWGAGPEVRSRMRRNFGQVFGSGAQANEEVLDAMIELALTEGRRPLARNPLDHPEVSGDENAFALMVAAAVGGEREDALVLALALMRPQGAFEAVAVAEALGLVLLGLVRARPDAAPRAGRH